MNVFQLRDQLIEDYSSYITSFIRIKDERISQYVDEQLDAGLLWPDPLIQLNPSFKPGAWIDDLVEEGLLHEECRRIFRKKDENNETGNRFRLHQHQEDAIRIAQKGENYVLTTGTGSGKSLTYIIPIVDHVLKRGSQRGIQAIIVYPMNALANSQLNELTKFINLGYPNREGPIRFARYTGQESDQEKNEIMASPPDILLTNYVMLELILTRPGERRTLVNAAQGLRFLVLDELHTYRGRQGADVAMLVRRVREALNAENMQCIGTSATLAGVGSYDEQRKEVARVATQFFGSPVKPENVIGETLQRATPESNISDSEFIKELKFRIRNGPDGRGNSYQEFIHDPLSIWIEDSIGITQEDGNGRLIRQQPRSVSGSDGAAKTLAEQTGLPVEECRKAIENGLLYGYAAEPNPETGFPAFAFRLNQFISRGDTVYATLEPEESRYITVHGQQYVPGDRSKVLLPLVFCRECGQEYFSVYRKYDREHEKNGFLARKLGDPKEVDSGDPGYLFLSSSKPWPSDDADIFDRLPDDWLEMDGEITRVRQGRRKYIPEAINVDMLGTETPDGDLCHFVTEPFRFCLNCGISYDFRQRSDFGKLSELGAGGRSTATTILSLSTVRGLQNQKIDKIARKLLSFTDNRQDASLQAGHFNDFIEISVLRGALFRAVLDSDEDGIKYDELTQKVFSALNLPRELYAQEPEVRFAHIQEEIDSALRDILGYRLYFDLRRGWRVTSPNLEQCGLLEIKYPSLQELCEMEEIWGEFHPALSRTTAGIRYSISKVLLDYMRRELAIDVNYLQNSEQERIQQRSSQNLIPPWAIDENEKMENASILYPRPRKRNDGPFSVFLSARGGYGMYLRRTDTFPDYPERLNIEETGLIIEQLLAALTQARLVKIVSEPRGDDQVPGYQVPASAMKWFAGDGTKAYHDPIRVPNLPEGGGHTNPFFVRYYQTIAGEVIGFEAREHTAQVDYEDREEREKRFREGKLPVLYCSPTMELGIDISLLNAVNMRNIPPTPANYAQRSGRAGRSGQPALVFTYCSTGSPHDQYFFKRPEQMVAGAVSPPRIDLTNEDLLRAHLQAIWLAETGANLGTSLKDVLEITEDDPSLELNESILDSISKENAKQRARNRIGRVLSSIETELLETDWFNDDWLNHVISNADHQFDLACNRWRDLYRSAMKQREKQHRIIGDAARTPQDRKQAERLRREAESQIKLLLDAQNVIQSDFYSYRYFASEGFLPGYNFPRLPLSAYLPARRVRSGKDEFLSRPRFLAISEFGPQSYVYHEGSRYQINKVIMPVTSEEDGDVLATSQVKICPNCGYLHPIHNEVGLDLCEWCRKPLESEMGPMFRLQNVSTRRRDRINSDEEERLRMGFEICTTLQFPKQNGRFQVRSALLKNQEETIAKLSYGDAVEIRRINLGWRNRTNPNQYGFVLDIERGYWAKNEANEDDPTDPLSPNRRRVIPYVEDRKNCLLFEPAKMLDMREMASLAAALKNAIQVEFQLEDRELSVEPLPSGDIRRLLLFYEASEGGAGVLRQLVTNPLAFPEIAKAALSVCHFDTEGYEDLRRAPRAQEDCEAACYDCLMSYFNQRDHLYLDRHVIRDLLIDYSNAFVEASPGPEPRHVQLQRLKNLCGSDLEKDWLDYIDQHDYNLPSKAQHLIEACSTRPDFLYENPDIAVYIDGYHHLFPDRQARDQDQTDCLEDLGYIVLRFGILEDWQELITKNSYIFGPGKQT